MNTAIKRQLNTLNERITTGHAEAARQRERVEQAEAVLTHSGRKGDGSPQAASVRAERERLSAVERELAALDAERQLVFTAIAASPEPLRPVPFSGLVYGTDGRAIEVGPGRSPLT